MRIIPDGENCGATWRGPIRNGDILNRAIDQAGADGWGGVLSRGIAPGGGDPRTFVASQIVRSAEGAQDPVAGFYKRYPGRSATSVGCWAGARLLSRVATAGP